ncbi:MAG: ATP-binding protein [Desulforhopalus sp.]|nr:ATP-binding protein [Desulforhopalus sp.]
MTPLPANNPPGEAVFTELPAKLENLPLLIGPVLAAARALGVTEDRCNDLELALEETLVNICSYAYPDREGRVRISYKAEKDFLLVCIEDDGIAFSLVDAAGPDLSVELAARTIGGLGVHLVRSLMDDVRYRRENGRNLLELVLFIEDPAVRE